MAKQNYWDFNQEDLVYQWAQANTAQQFGIYDKLQKHVNYMAGAILGRYFMYTNDNNDIKRDAINHLFCVMHRFDPERGKTAYSYCQTILKNYYHDVAKNKKGKVFAVTLEYYDDLEAPQFNYSYEYIPFDEETHCFEPVFVRLEQARYKLLCYLHDHKRLPHSQRQTIQREINLLNTTTEFFYNYKDSQGIDKKAVTDYVQIQSGLHENTVAQFTKKHLGFQSYLCRKYESKIQKKYGFTYLEDDFTPDTTVVEIERYRKNNRNNKQYNDGINYNV